MRTTRSRTLLSLAALLGGLLAGGCPGTKDEGRISKQFKVRGTVGQIYVWGTTPETAFEVLSPDGTLAATGITDEMGGLVFRELAPGEGYRVQLAADPDEHTAPVTVLSVEGSQPPDSFYDQPLTEGFGYITMRDGVTLSAFVYLPGPPEDGPYPTIVNYSGYSPSRPGRVISEEVELFCDDLPVLCNAPDHPSGLLAGLQGYASVGVNMRGTGCSGGAYDYFEPLQLLDGYDIVEIVARQQWVLHNQVGMAGLSFPGISQLFVAQTQPPRLAAISPMSVIADTASSCLAPGGIYNLGFALDWIEHVLDRAAPYGHGWIQELVDAGDTVCEENQLLHAQKLDAVAKALDNPYYTDEVAKPVDPSSFVDQIQVPVYLSGHFQDEQTGPHFATLFDKFTGSPSARFHATNGVHQDGFAPQMALEWWIFMDLYVARRVPRIDPLVRSLVPLLFNSYAGVSLELPPNRFEDYTDYETALADYEAEPPVRIIFETGASTELGWGAPVGTFEQRFDEWPLPGTEARRWYFQPDGSLAAAPPPAGGGASDFDDDPDAAHRVTLASGSVNDLVPDWDWRQPAPGFAVVFESAPLAQTLVMIGSGSVDLWVQSTAEDADLEVTLSEVRADGQETLVQSGWLRASHRALRDDATELRPVKTHREADAAPLPAGVWTEARVELMPMSHIFRAGSRLRILVDSPGDSCARWFFIGLEHETNPTHSVAHQAAYPSSVVLPVVPGVEVTTPLPACGALRGQPCRPHLPYVNTPSTVN